MPLYHPLLRPLLVSTLNSFCLACGKGCSSSSLRHSPSQAQLVSGSHSAAKGRASQGAVKKRHRGTEGEERRRKGRVRERGNREKGKEKSYDVQAGSSAAPAAAAAAAAAGQDTARGAAGNKQVEADGGESAAVAVAADGDESAAVAVAADGGESAAVAVAADGGESAAVAVAADGAAAVREEKAAAAEGAAAASPGNLDQATESKGLSGEREKSEEKRGRDMSEEVEREKDEGAGLAAARENAQQARGEGGVEGVGGGGEAAGNAGGEENAGNEREGMRNHGVVSLVDSDSQSEDEDDDDDGDDAVGSTQRLIKGNDADDNDKDMPLAFRSKCRSAGFIGPVSHLPPSR
ncbi:unnamed protein product, partial [Closterium sp. NIES-53]